MYSGDTNRSAVLYDSLRADSVPFEGVISDGSSIRIDFLAQEPAATTAFNIRFEGAVSPWWDTGTPAQPGHPAPAGSYRHVAAGRVLAVPSTGGAAAPL